jgi:hypothetical protein
MTASSTEEWTYAGLRDEGKSVHWIDPKGEICPFAADKSTKAIAVGSQYEIHNIQRSEEGLVSKASFGNKKWIRQSDVQLEDVRAWTVKDEVARQAINRKKTVNKIKKQNDEDWGEMSLIEIQQ